jgi:NADH-quinone oxidoreductase subunit M
MSFLLVLTILVPMFGGLALMALPGLELKTVRWTALGAVGLSLAMSLILLLGFDASADGYQYVHESEESLGWSWIDISNSDGIRLAFGLDGISLPLFALTNILMLTSVMASWGPIRDRPATFYGLLLMLQAGLLGLFSSLDVILFYIFFEFTLIPLFFLIGLFGGPDRKRASVTFFLYTLVGSLFTLLGVIALVIIHYLYSPNEVLTFSIPRLTEGLATVGDSYTSWSADPSLRWDEGLITFLSHPQIIVFLLLFAGFAIKVPLFPVHTWLPLAHVEAPTAGSIILAGVLLKVGGYGLIRFNLAMTPIGSAALQPAMLAISAAGIIYGALAALAQTDVKRLVAYSSVSHMGFVTLGLFALNPVGVNGAVMQMINHGITTGALFACVGVVYDRYHTREMGQLGGLWARLPLFALFLMLSALGSAAVPGLNGFVGEFPILVGAFEADPTFAVISAVGMVLGAYYLMTMLRRLLFGPVVEPESHDDQGGHYGASAVPPVHWYESVGLVPLMVLIVWLGLYPAYWFDRMANATDSVVVSLARAQEHVPPKRLAAEPSIAASPDAPGRFAPVGGIVRPQPFIQEPAR